jgi:hypothetical protein
MPEVAGHKYRRGDCLDAFAAFASAPREAIHSQAINVGSNSEYYQVRDVGGQGGHPVTDGHKTSRRSESGLGHHRWSFGMGSGRDAIQPWAITRR